MARKKKTGISNEDFLKLVIAALLLLMIPLSIFAFQSFRAPVGDAAPPAGKGKGNNAPKGNHFTLNVIGVPKDKKADMSGGSRLFVSLTGKTKINLFEGEFYVLDANGTDGTAEFRLPAADPDNDGITEYTVWVRALGKPGGSSTTTPCAEVLDPETGEMVTYCSVEQVLSVREKGKSKFGDVSKQLLYVYVDLDEDGKVERYPLFDEALQNYFWDYDNKGLKLLQMRFYPAL